MESTVAPPGPPARRLWLGFALAALALQLATITQYGYFRDELYYLVCARHLAWGYVDQPPLSLALLALTRMALGESLVAIRLLPALAGAATVYVTGMIARELGGRGFAQALACLAALLSPVFLGTAHVFSMNVFDLLLWTLAALLLTRILRDGRPRDWVWLGVLMGLGLLNKVSMLWLGMGLLAGLVLTRERRWLATPWPYLGGAIAAVMFLPHLIWQVVHGFPTLEFMRNATRHKMVDVSWVQFVTRQALEMGPANAVVWLPGLCFALFARGGRRWRLLGILYLAVALLLLAGGRSRASYLAVAYPMLLALGGVVIEGAFDARWRALRGVIFAVVLALGLVPIPFALPLLPVDRFIFYQQSLHMTPSTEEHLQVGLLPQHYADMFGWEEMVREVAAAYEMLSPEERKHVVVFGQNYGEAGAIDVLGKKYGLPRAISGHNSYWLWGYGDWDGSVLIIIGGDPQDNARWFERVTRVGSIQSRYAMPYERGIDVSIGRRLTMPPAAAWPRLRMFI